MVGEGLAQRLPRPVLGWASVMGLGVLVPHPMSSLHPTSPPHPCILYLHHTYILITWCLPFTFHVPNTMVPYCNHIPACILHLPPCPHHTPRPHGTLVAPRCPAGAVGSGVPPQVGAAG